MAQPTPSLTVPVPNPALTGEGATQAFDRAVREHFRWNYWTIAGVEGCWGFGEALISQAAILPAFLRLLGASDVVLGLLPAVFVLCLMAPQLLAARATRGLAVKKVVFTLTHYPGCLCMLPLAVMVWLLSESRPGVVMVATFVCIGLFGLSISFAMPMWINLMAKLFPSSIRGRSFGYVFLLGGLLGAVGSATAARILSVFAYPLNFALLFLTAGVLMSACVTSFFWLREPACPHAAAEHADGHAFVAGLMDFLRPSPDYRWFLASRFVGAFGLMGGAFYTVAGMERFEVPAATAGTFGAVLLCGRSFGSVAAGRLGDRFGFKLVAVMAPAFDAAAAAIALMAPSAGWYYAVFVLYGLRSSFAMVGNHNLTIEFCPTADKTTFVALGSTILCPAFVLAPSIGGFLATHHAWRYDAVFVVSLASSVLAALLVLAKVREPRR